MDHARLESLLMRLNGIGVALSSEQDLDVLLGKILREARHFTDAEAGSLYLAETEGLRFVVAQNEALAKRMGDTGTNRIFRSSVIPLTVNSLAGYVGVTGEVVNIPDAYQIPPDRPYTFLRDFDERNNYRTRSMLLVPMKDPSGAVIGVLQLINARSAGAVVSFDTGFETLVLSLASQAAVAVTNAQLTDKLKRAYRDTVLALAVAAEFRDLDTAAHIRRMSAYCHVIAQEMGLPAADCEMILFASPMHDVGKIGVPDAILRKPGKLTDEEYAEMKKHTLYGEKILSISDAEVLAVSRSIAATHHEKWDGSGYPRGLAGEAIPLFGRIAALADVFDALTSARCYKPPFPLERALAIIEGDRGKHFDPAVVDAFKRGYDRILKHKEEFADENLELARL